MWMTLKAFLKKPRLMTPQFALSPLKCANKMVGKMCRINLIACFLSCLYREKTISSLTIATDHPKPNTNFLREKRSPRKLWYLPPNLELFMQSCYDIHRTEGDNNRAVLLGRGSQFQDSIFKRKCHVCFMSASASDQNDRKKKRTKMKPLVWLAS